MIVAGKGNENSVSAGTERVRVKRAWCLLFSEIQTQHHQSQCHEECKKPFYHFCFGISEVFFGGENFGILFACHIWQYIHKKIKKIACRFLNR